MWGIGGMIRTSSDGDTTVVVGGVTSLVALPLPPEVVVELAVAVTVPIVDEVAADVGDVGCLAGVVTVRLRRLMVARFIFTGR